MTTLEQVLHQLIKNPNLSAPGCVRQIAESLLVAKEQCPDFNADKLAEETLCTLELPCDGEGGFDLAGLMGALRGLSEQLTAVSRLLECCSENVALAVVRQEAFQRRGKPNE